MRDTLLSALSSTNDLFSIIPNYSDGVWPREMMLSNDTDSGDVARKLIYVITR